MSEYMRCFGSDEREFCALSNRWRNSRALLVFDAFSFILISRNRIESDFRSCDREPCNEKF